MGINLTITCFSHRKFQIHAFCRFGEIMCRKTVINQPSAYTPRQLNLMHQNISCAEQLRRQNHCPHSSASMVSCISSQSLLTGCSVIAHHWPCSQYTTEDSILVAQLLL